MKNNKKNTIIIITIIVALIVFICTFIFIVNNKKDKDLKSQEEKQKIADTPLNIALNENNIPKYINGSFSNHKVTDEESALKALEDIKDLMSIKDLKNEFYLKEKFTYSDISYYELQQKINGIDVLGGELTISVDKDGNVKGLNGNYLPDLYVSTYGLMSEEKVKEKILEIYGEKAKIYNINKYVYVDSSKYVIYLIGVATDKNVYEVVMNAKTGEIITEDNAVNYYSYTGKGIDNKEYNITINEVTDILQTKYTFEDKVRNISIVDCRSIGADLTGIIITSLFSKWTPITFNINNGITSYLTNTDSDKELIKSAVTAMKYYEEIYDYYKEVLGRDSYDNKGSEIVINLGVSDSTFSNEELVNAAWLTLNDQMYIGSYNGVSLALAKDALAHEFTHGVISYTAGFENPTKENRNKVNETGALNEGYADILGSIIENKNWTIAESLDVNLVKRDLTNPGIYEKPSVVEDQYYYPTKYLKDRTIEQFLADNNLDTLFDYDQGGVHQNSTVVGHAAYLMYENGAFSNKDEMAKVWYNSLFLLSSHSNFEDCSYAVIQAAANLGIKQEKINIIRDAFVETKMLSTDFYELSGQVLDEDNNKPIYNALVSITNKKNPYIIYETYTDKDGKYIIENIPSGSYLIEFDKPKYSSYDENADLNKNIICDAKLKKIPTSEAKYSEIVFVMDISSSMDTSDPYDTRKKVISNTISSLDDNSKLALIVFAKNAKVINDGLNNNIDKRDIITDVFYITNDSGFTSNSGTNGKSGIEAALSLFSSNLQTNKYIIFLTDGMDTVSGSYDTLIEKANDKKIKILSIGLGTGTQIDEEKLKNIAEQTSGKYYHATNSLRLSKFTERILEEIQ